MKDMTVELQWRALSLQQIIQSNKNIKGKKTNS